MNLRIIVIVGAALATIGVGAASLRLSKPAPTRVSSPDVASDRAPLETQVAERHKEARSMRVPLETSGTAQAAAESPSNPGDEEAEPGSEWTNPVERQQQEVATLTRSLEAHFAGETIDPSWSHSMELTLRGELVAKATGSTVLESRCATTMCRIVLRHETRQLQRELASVVSDLVPFRPGVFYAYDASTKPPQSTLYVMRTGYDFPAVNGS
jgi:hypothetical protein